MNRPSHWIGIALFKQEYNHDTIRLELKVCVDKRTNWSGSEHKNVSWIWLVNRIFSHPFGILWEKITRLLAYHCWFCKRSPRVIFPQLPVSSLSNLLQISIISFSVTFCISFSLYMTYSDLLHTYKNQQNYSNWKLSTKRWQLFKINEHYK